MTTIPTINELYLGIKADIEAKYEGNIPSFGKNFLRALAMTQAGKLKIFYLGIAFIQKNLAPDTADLERNGGMLERFGRIKLGRNPDPARAGQYSLEVTGQTGATIPAQTTFKSNDDALSAGMLYVLDTEKILAGPTDSIIVRALVSGEGSRLEVGDQLTATQPIANVDRVTEVLAEVVEPLAAEDIEEYRDQVILANRTEPQGGSSVDYKLWGRIQGIENIYDYATSGQANEIDLFIEATVIDSTDGKGTPSAGLITAVQTAVELKRPLGVFEINYYPIAVQEVDIEITDFVGIDADIETLIFDAIELMISQIRPFIAGADVSTERNDVLDVNRIISKILETRPGSQFGAVELTVDGIVVSTYQFDQGEIPHLDTITYV